MRELLTIILVLVVADVLLVAYLVFKRVRKGLTLEAIEKIKKEWKVVNQEGDHRHTILEADKLLDYALKQLGYKGSLGAKLKKAPTLFSDINGVWSAHKIRNNIAHKINYKVDAKAYRKAMKQFEQAFRDLDIFD